MKKIITIVLAIITIQVSAQQVYNGGSSSPFFYDQPFQFKSSTPEIICKVSPSKDTITILSSKVRVIVVDGVSFEIKRSVSIEKPEPTRPFTYGWPNISLTSQPGTIRYTPDGKIEAIMPYQSTITGATAIFDDTIKTAPLLKKQKQ